MTAVRQWLLDQATKNYIPLNATIELGLGCNLSCQHCYNFDRKDRRPKQNKKSMPPGRILTLIDELAEAGNLVVAFTGGEALLHPHLEDFVKRARSRNLVIRLKTNGTLLSYEKVQALQSWGVSELEVSLYGATAKTHDEFTRTPGSFLATWEGVKNAQSAGLYIKVNYILHHKCVDDFPEMLAKVEAADLEFSVSTELTKRYDDTEDSLDLRLTTEDLRKLYSGPRKYFFAGNINTQDSVQCGCAKINCGIGHDGTVYPCIGAPIPAGSLTEKTFGDIWRNSSIFAEIRGLTLASFKDCAPCKVRPYCQRSSGAIFTNTGNYTGKEDWTCSQAHLLEELNQSLDLTE